MVVIQVEDKELSHFSYMILSEEESEIILIDPSRDPKQYYEFAEKRGAKIIGVIETHLHADFVSSHLEIRNKSAATIFISEKADADYPHQLLDDGDVIEHGECTLRAINTPGHSNDSICIVLSEEGKDTIVFTGDTLLIGDCGRPDLRERSEEADNKREDLARKMYRSLREKILTLNNSVKVFPAHGAGSLCGKGISEKNKSTIGEERISNWCLQNLSEEDFVKELLSGQSYIPKYFPHDVELNRRGAGELQQAMSDVVFLEEIDTPVKANSLSQDIKVIDTRHQKDFKNGHLANSINLPEGPKFETWLGSIFGPDEEFYLAAETKPQLLKMARRVAKIGYEKNIKAAFVVNYVWRQEKELDLQTFKENPEDYTIVDVRNPAERQEKVLFQKSIHIPLYELRERLSEIPADKPVVLHCSGGYRSAAASSILNSELDLPVGVFDLSTHVEEFQ